MRALTRRCRASTAHGGRAAAAGNQPSLRPLRDMSRSTARALSVTHARAVRARA